MDDAITPEVVVHVAERLREVYSSLPDGEKLLFAAFCQASGEEGEVTGYGKGDITNFDPGRHFVSVLMQQGRVQQDADTNQQASRLSRNAELALSMLATWPPK